MAAFGSLVAAVWREAEHIRRDRAAIADTAAALHTVTQETMASACAVRSLRYLHWQRRFAQRAMKETEEAAAKLREDETEIEFYEVHQLLPQTGENVAKALAVVASHPRLLAQCFVKSAQGLKQLSLRHCDRLLSIVLWHLFDESWEPDATNATTIFLHTLLEARLKTNKGQEGSPVQSISLFSRALQVSLASGSCGWSAFLTAALRPTLVRLLDISAADVAVPMLVYDSLVLASSMGEQRADDDEEQNSFKQRMEEHKADVAAARQEIVDLCRSTLSRLRSMLDSLPPLLSDLIQLLQSYDYNGTMIVGDFLVSRCLCPALMHPDLFGILPRRSLRIEERQRCATLASALLVASGARTHPIDSNWKFLASVRTEFTESFRAWKPAAQRAPSAYPRDLVNQRGRRKLVALTCSQVKALLDMVEDSRTAFQENENPHLRKVAEALRAAHTPNELAELEEKKLKDGKDSREQVVIFPLDDDVGSGLLSEEVLLARLVKRHGAPTDSPSPSSALSKAAQDLRRAAAECDPSTYWLKDGTDLLYTLRLLAREMEAQGQSKAALLASKAVASLETLSEAEKTDNFFAVKALMQTQYALRQPYIAYVAASRQSLETSLAIVRNMDREIRRQLQEAIYSWRTILIEAALNQNPGILAQFVGDIRSDYTAPEEYSRVLEEALTDGCAALRAHPYFEEASETEINSVTQELERILLGLIYESVMSPPSSEYSDKLEKLKDISPSHPALDIPTAFQEGAPWPEVQDELRLISAFIAPADKLACVVAACKRIQTALQLCGASAGADDVFPVLVFCIIRAQLIMAPSEVEYIEAFGQQHVTVGEAAYWWTQFASAVQFIETFSSTTA